MIDVKDRIIQYPRRFKLTLVEGETDVYELTPVTGTVQEEGTPINAELFDSISADIVAEANTRLAADTVLQSNIDAEAEARENAVTAVDNKVNVHIAAKNNPHSVTKSQVGLENVANERQYSAQNPPPYPVTSVAGKIGAVTLGKSDVGLGSVDNTADKDKPVSTAQATAIAEAKKAGTDAQATADAHIARTDNPHSVTAAQIGAEPAFDKNSAFNKNFGTESGTVCEGNDGRLEGNVKYTAQSLSEEQQAQARNNINALSADEADIRYIPVDCDHEFEITGYTGHEENLKVPEQCQVIVSKIKGQTRRKSLNLIKGTSKGDVSGASTALWRPLNLVQGKTYTIQIYCSVSCSCDFRDVNGEYVSYIGGAVGLNTLTFTKGEESILNIYLDAAGSWWVMLVEGSYTADTMPAYQPYNNKLVNSKVKNVLSTGKNLYSGKNDLDWTPSYLENKYPLYLDKGTYSICVYAENPSGTNQYQFQGLDEYGNEVFSTPGVFVNTGTSIEVTIPISKILLYVNTTGHIKVMLNYGTSVLPYEPYIADDTFGVDIEMTGFGEIDNISKQYTEYGSANIITLDGSADENWSRGQTITADHWRFVWVNSALAGTAAGGAANINCISNWIDGTPNQTLGGVTCLSVDGHEIQICNESIETVEGLRAWLAANPIQFIYRLATPRIQTTVDIPAGYSAHKGGLQQQVIEDDYLPYILTKNYPISMAAQTASLMEVDRKQSILINKNAADIAQKTTEIASNTEAIEKISDGTTAVGKATNAEKKLGVAVEDDDIVNKAYLISMLALYSERPAIASLSTNFDFTKWSDWTTGYFAGENIPYLDITAAASESTGTVIAVPDSSANSIAEASITEVLGDTGYIKYIYEGKTNFTARAVQRVYAPASSMGTARSVTFELRIKDIYENEFSKQFTVNFKA